MSAPSVPGATGTSRPAHDTSRAFDQALMTRGSFASW